MKRRIGFVANSSSSSFVIDRGRFDSVFKLAIHMLKHRDYERLDGRVIRTIRSSTLDPNTPVSFSSTNIDTYIAIKNGDFVVNTCSNIDWDIEDGIIQWDVDGQNKNVTEIETEFDFWFPEYELIGRIHKDDNGDSIHCTEHTGIEFIRLKKDGLVVCPACYWNEYIRYKKGYNHKEKIKLLRNSIKKLDQDFFIKLLETKNGKNLWEELHRRVED